MDVFAKHAADLAKLETYYAQGVSLFSYAAVSGTCLSSSLTEGEDLGIGGYADNAGIRIVIRTILFGDPANGPVAIPQTGKTIFFQRTANVAQRKLRIESVVESSDTQVTLICIDPTKGV